MDDAEFDRRVSKSRQFVHELDRMDRYKDRELKTILFALEAGLRGTETDAAFDAYVMLKELVDGQ